MPMNARVRSLVLAVTLLGTLMLAAPAALAVGPCAPGAAYDPACDVDENGVINILDIQLIASRFNLSGSFNTGGWLLTGNAGTTPGTHFVGTTDNVAFELKVNGGRALRIAPTVTSPNLTWGYAANTVSSNAIGAVVGGGGTTAGGDNTVADSFGVVGGGASNLAGSSNGNPTDAMNATVSGGFNNWAIAPGAHVGGGEQNDATGNQATIGGGNQNTASGTRSTISGGYGNNATTNSHTSVGGGALHFATGANARVGGGSQNKAGGESGVAVGGVSNEASSLGSTVGGGAGSWVYTGAYGTIPGGSVNRATGTYSLAAGQYASAIRDGAFVWADSVAGEFASAGINTWRVRATNGSDFSASSATYGLYSSNTATGDGFQTESVTSNGNIWAALFASNSGTSPGLYANSTGTYAGYFADAISVSGGCTGCTLTVMAVNAGDRPLRLGDLVAAAGVDSPLAGMTDPVLRVVPAGGDSVLGVATRRLAVTLGARKGEPLASVQATDGPIRPGDHLLVIVQGLAQARVVDSAGVVAGQKLTAGDAAGGARALRDVEARGFNTPVLGIALDTPDPASGLVPVLVTVSAH